MKDVTQTISNLIVSGMSKKRKYTEYEEQVFTYGVELILNSVLKIIVYLIIGKLLGILRELVFAIILFGLLRKVSGGAHSKTNIGCFLITGSILMLSVYSSYILNLSKIAYLFMGLITWGLYMKYAPLDEYYQEKGREIERDRQKTKTIVLVGFLLFLGYLVNDYWRMIVLSICFLQALTLIKVSWSGVCFCKRKER